MMMGERPLFMGGLFFVWDEKELGIFVRGERRRQTVAELVEVRLDYAEPMPKIMRTKSE